MNVNDLVISCFGRALFHLLEDTEGIVVQIGDGKYIVYKEGSEIKLNDINDEDEEFLKNSPDGQLIWMHDGYIN